MQGGPREVRCVYFECLDLHGVLGDLSALSS